MLYLRKNAIYFINQSSLQDSPIVAYPTLSLAIDVSYRRGDTHSSTAGCSRRRVKKLMRTVVVVKPDMRSDTHLPATS